MQAKFVQHKSQTLLKNVRYFIFCLILLVQINPDKQLHLIKGSLFMVRVKWSRQHSCRRHLLLSTSARRSSREGEKGGSR